MTRTNPANVVPAPRVLRSAAVAALVVCAGALIVAGVTGVAGGTTGSSSIRYLFSIPSAGGSLTGADDHQLTLRLRGARNYLTRFTDRPVRRAYVAADSDFARRFSTYFSGSAPNAVLTYTPHGAQIPVSIVLTISHPRWSARQATWTMAAVRIRKQLDNLPGPTVRIKPPSIPNPRAFQQATLLIDDSIDNGEQGG